MFEWAKPVVTLLLFEEKTKPKDSTVVVNKVCMHLMIGKGQIAQKDHIGAK